MKLSVPPFVYKLIFYFLIILFFIYNTFYLYHNIVIVKDSWNLGDWLINYQDGGFKRRGLLGSIVLLFNDITGIKLELIVFLFIVFLQITFYFFLVKLLKDNKNIAVLSLLLSPLVLQFSLVDPNVIGKKDILIFATYAYFVYIINNNKKSKYFYYILLFVGTLIHEYFIFFVGYFVWALILSKKYSYKDYLFTFSSVLIPVFLVFFVGGNINEGMSFQLLKSRGLDLNNSGILAWKYDKQVPSNIWNAWQLYSLYFVSLTLGICHFSYYLKIYFFKNYKRMILVFMILLIASTPLFYLGTDWGRWLNIHFTLFLLTLLALKKESLSNQNNHNNIIYILICCSNFIWGFNHFGNGFHFYTKLNLLLSKIFSYIF